MKKTRSPASRITVAHGANDVDIAIDGRTVVTASDLSGLIASAHGLGDADPLRIHRESSLSIDLPPSDKRTLLAEIRVEEKEANLLAGRRQKLLENHLVWKTRPIDRGICVDGKPWGWFYASPDSEEGCWHLVPRGRSTVVLQAGANFVGDSMVGGYMDVGIRRYGEATAITWHYQEDDPANCAISYEVDYWDELCIDCLSTIFEEPLCPLGSEADDWLVQIDADPMFSTDTIGKAMAGIWLPCEKHLRSGKPLIVRNIAGSNWEWKSNSWAQLPST